MVVFNYPNNFHDNITLLYLVNDLKLIDQS